MIIVLYGLAGVTGGVSLWCGYLLLSWEAGRQLNLSTTTVELQAMLAFLTMVVCLATASILRRLDALRHNALTAPSRPPRPPWTWRLPAPDDGAAAPPRTARARPVATPGELSDRD